MADPLSVLGSLAGVSTAGVQISLLLYEVVDKIVNAPKEVADVAQEMSLLSSVLRNVGDVLKEGHRLYKPRLIEDLRALVSRVGAVQKDLKKITLGVSGIRRLKWVFRSTRVKTLLAKIESLKSAMTLILCTMHLAAHQRQHEGTNADSSSGEENSYRQLAENLVEVNRVAIRKLRNLEIRQLQENHSSKATAADSMPDQATQAKAERPEQDSLPGAIVQSQPSSSDLANWLDALVIGSEDRHEGTTQDDDSEQHLQFGTQNDLSAISYQSQIYKLESEGSRSSKLWSQRTVSGVLDGLLQLWTSLDDEAVANTQRNSGNTPGDSWADSVRENLFRNIPNSHASSDDTSGPAGENANRHNYWGDPIDPSNPDTRTQPPTSNLAMQKISGRSFGLQTASIAATLGSRRLSESDLSSLTGVLDGQKPQRKPWLENFKMRSQNVGKGSPNPNSQPRESNTARRTRDGEPYDPGSTHFKRNRLSSDSKPVQNDTVIGNIMASRSTRQFQSHSDQGISPETQFSDITAPTLMEIESHRLLEERNAAIQHWFTVTEFGIEDN